MKAVSIALLMVIGSSAFAAKEVPFCQNIQEQVNLQCIPQMDIEGYSADAILDCQSYYLEQYVGDAEVQAKCHIDYANRGNWFNKPSKPYRLRDKN